MSGGRETGPRRRAMFLPSASTYRSSKSSGVAGGTEICSKHPEQVRAMIDAEPSLRAAEGIGAPALVAYLLGNRMDRGTVAGRRRVYPVETGRQRERAGELDVARSADGWSKKSGGAWRTRLRAAGDCRGRRPSVIAAGVRQSVAGISEDVRSEARSMTSREQTLVPNWACISGLRMVASRACRGHDRSHASFARLRRTVCRRRRPAFSALPSLCRPRRGDRRVPPRPSELQLSFAPVVKRVGAGGR